MGKIENKGKKDKKERKEKKRKRQRDDSSDSDDDRAQRRLKREAERLTKALQKGGVEPIATEQGAIEGGGRFVWKKKIEKELQEGASTKDIYQRERSRTEAERRAEIEKVQRRREEREQEKEQREREQEQLARDRAAAEAVELERKEDEFHLDNAKARARHRLMEGREKPIDFLVRDLMLGDEFEVGAEEPYKVFESLTLAEVQELREDILEYQELDSEDPEHAAWWESLLVVCDEELKEAAKQDNVDRAKMRRERPLEARRHREVGVHSAVDAEIQSLLAGQTYGELVRMEEDLQSELERGTAPDPEFHSAILRRLTQHKAKAQLREMQRTLMARSLASGDQKISVPSAMGWRDEYLTRKPSKSPERERPPSPEPSQLPGIEESQEAEEATNAGQWSPEPLEAEDFVGQDVVPEEDDTARLQLLRKQVRWNAAANFGTVAPERPAEGSGQAGTQPAGILGSAPQEADTRRFEALAAKAMGDINEARDAPFRGEVQLESKVYWWHDKYRPRKPKYFNRVHTGYEWNKYNQTHYDHDNPPPKVVQGYKFNIFYPDLISKKTAPEYTIEADPAADEFGSTCILRFHAGPPYEDLTFRILNREWEYSHKKGFKCVFDRDTLYLYFNFKRQRYRR